MCFVASCTSDDVATLTIDYVDSSATSAISTERKAISVENMISLTDLGGMAGEGLAVSPDGNYVAFQMHRAILDRNEYEAAWYVLALTERQEPVNIGDAGNPLFFKSKTGSRINGAWRSTIPVWSPDSEWVAYRKMENESVQIWRSSLDGNVQEQLTFTDSNVDAFHWANNTKQIVFETDASIKEQSAYFASKAERGIWAGENGFDPKSKTYLLQPYELTSGQPELQLLDVSSKQSRRATQDEIKRYFGARNISLSTIGSIRRTNNMPGRPRSSGVTVSRDEKHIAWLEANAEAVLPVLRVWARQGDAESRNVKCGFDQCFGHIEKLWWNSDASEVIFLRREGANLGSQGIYSWNIERDSVRKIYGDNLRHLSACASAGDGLVCFSDSPGHPRIIVSLNFVDGLVTTRFDPNPEFDRVLVGETERIEWKNEYGVKTWGYIVRPLSYEEGRRYPLVIVQYRARACFKGGVGDEYPVHLFAAAEFMVLCFDEPGLWQLFESMTLAEEQRVVWEDYYERRVILESLHSAVELLSNMGLVDSKKVGLTGLSSGTDTISFALSNSNRFSAAVSSSGGWSPISYYLMPEWAKEFNRSRGFGRPGSVQDKYWSGMSLGVNAGKVMTPLLVQVSDNEVLYQMYDYVTLKELGKPVDMYVFKDEYHIKWHPQNRKAAAERAVDWMRFWLKDEEDDDPAKTAQYEHWRNLRNQRQTTQN